MDGVPEVTQQVSCRAEIQPLTPKGESFPCHRAQGNSPEPRPMDRVAETTNTVSAVREPELLEILCTHTYPHTQTLAHMLSSFF